MFRIKTDIRQYKCESREKVERLIRNWVVRPTDLIFYDEKQAWGPIGEHSEFVATFAELAQREAEAPDTVVSSEPPGGMDGESKGAPSKPPVATRSQPPDQDPEPPEPPEGLESASASPDEVTVMTEETLDDILEEGEERGGDISVVETHGGESEEPDTASSTSGGGTADEALSPAADDTIPPDEEGFPPDEETLPPEDSGEQEVTRPEAKRPDREDGEVTEPSAKSSTDGEFAPNPAPPDEETDPEGEEAGRDAEDLRDTDEIDENGTGNRSRSGQYDVAPPREERPPTASSNNGPVVRGRGDDNVGRHDLPEEIFATNEIKGSQEEQSPGGSAGNGNGRPDYADVEEALQENARHAARQEHIDDEWDEILERLRDTDELSKEELEEITKTRDQIAIGRDEGEDDDLVEEIDPEHIEEYVSEGYDKELPIRIGPTRRDVQLGLRRSTASANEKDRVFP